jgi:hypothetical protein
MSASGISSSIPSANEGQSFLSKRVAIQKEFQQLGQDLTSGNLSAAQTDFTSLQQLVPKLNTVVGTQSTDSTDPRVAAFTKLETDIQSGDLSAAQKEYGNIQQIFQDRAEQRQGDLRHHERGLTVGSGVESQTSQALSQAPQTDNISVAQQAFAALQTKMNQNNAESEQTQSKLSLSVNA